MPGISGINLCARIKSHFDTSHIPVILLTALSSVEHNIKGLNCGADDYITKPFNIRILIAKCINLLNNRRKLQERYRTLENSSAEQLTDNKLDQDFIDQIIKIVQTRLDKVILENEEDNWRIPSFLYPKYKVENCCQDAS